MPLACVLDAAQEIKHCVWLNARRPEEFKKRSVQFRTHEQLAEIFDTQLK